MPPGGQEKYCDPIVQMRKLLFKNELTSTWKKDKDRNEDWDPGFWTPSKVLFSL